jgi:hypothetical protein
VAHPCAVNLEVIVKHNSWCNNNNKSTTTTTSTKKEPYTKTSAVCNYLNDRSITTQFKIAMNFTVGRTTADGNGNTMYDALIDIYGGAF